MIKYGLLLVIFLSETLFPKNLNENLKPVSENKNKYHVSTKNLKKNFSQDKHLIEFKAKTDRKNLMSEIKTKESSKNDRKNLISDFKKTTEKRREANKKTNKNFEERKVQERKRRRN